MAIRYSGDVEIRLRYERPRVVILVRSPKRRYRLEGKLRKAPSSKDYDRLARQALETIPDVLPIDKRGGRIVIRRGFVSPCPTRF